MKLELSFSTGGAIPLEVTSNLDLFTEWYNVCGTNEFYVDSTVEVSRINDAFRRIHNSISILNPYLKALMDFNFPELPSIGYLDQQLLNKMHSDWVNSQQVNININELSTSESDLIRQTYNTVVNTLPDAITNISLCVYFDIIGIRNSYEDLNLAIHYLENTFSHNISLSTAAKWDLIPLSSAVHKSAITSNVYHGLNFGFTYLGRQTYDKFKNFDEDSTPDYFNFEEMQQTFNFSLCRPETVSFSPEFNEWCNKKQIKPAGLSIPVASVQDLVERLTEYRVYLYQLLEAGGSATLTIKEL